MGRLQMIQDDLRSLREQYEAMHTRLRANNASYGTAYMEGALDAITTVLRMIDSMEKKPDVRNLEDP